MFHLVANVMTSLITSAVGADAPEMVAGDWLEERIFDQIFGFSLENNCLLTCSCIHLVFDAISDGNVYDRCAMPTWPSAARHCQSAVATAPAAARVGTLMSPWSSSGPSGAAWSC